MADAHIGARADEQIGREREDQDCGDDDRIYEPSGAKQERELADALDFHEHEAGAEQEHRDVDAPAVAAQGHDHQAAAGDEQQGEHDAVG